MTNEFKKSSNGFLNEELYYAIADGDINKISHTINKDNVNDKYENGWTPLMVACICGNIEIVKLLLACEGIQVNVTNENGWTPLMVACKSGHIEFVKLLLACEGIQVNDMNSLTRKQ